MNGITLLQRMTQHERDALRIYRDRCQAEGVEWTTAILADWRRDGSRRVARDLWLLLAPFRIDGTELLAAVELYGTGLIWDVRAFKSEGRCLQCRGWCRSGIRACDKARFRRWCFPCAIAEGRRQRPIVCQNPDTRDCDPMKPPPFEEKFADLEDVSAALALDVAEASTALRTPGALHLQQVCKLLDSIATRSTRLMFLARQTANAAKERRRWDKVSTYGGLR